MKYFFVDYENNQKECFSGFKNLDKYSVVYIYFTEKSSQMDVLVLYSFKNKGINYKLKLVSDNEKEAVDNRIKYDVFSLAKSINKDDCIYVVSSDKGFISVKNILEEKFGFSNYNCVSDFSCKAPDKKSKASDKGASQNKNKMKPAKATSTQNISDRKKVTNILANEVYDYLNSNKHKKFNTVQIHTYLQKKHGNFSLKKYGFSSMKKLLESVDGIQTENKKYYIA